MPPSMFLSTVPGRSGQACNEAWRKRCQTSQGLRCGLWLAPFPLLPRGRALRGTWDGPQGWAGLRQGLCSGGLRLAPGDTLRLCDRALEGLISADEGSGQVPAAALGLFELPNTGLRDEPPGVGLAGFDVEPPANRSALFRGRPNRAVGGSSSTALVGVSFF